MSNPEALPMDGSAKVYVASSWRNELQPQVVSRLRAAGYDVYDFRNPSPDDCGFHWSEIDPEWQRWDARTFRAHLGHKLATKGFWRDYGALISADAVVLVMPCGRSAHLELGCAVGRGKPSAILLSGGEPELMYKMAQLCVDIDEVLSWLGGLCL